MKKEIGNETICSECIHKDVCIKEDKFSNIIERITNSFSVSELALLEDDFRIVVECKHFKKKKKDCLIPGFHPKDEVE